MDFTIHDYEVMAEDARVPCEHCDNLASHYGDDGEPTCQACLRDKPRPVDNGDGTGSFRGVLVGLGF